MSNHPNFSSLIPPASANCGNKTIDHAVRWGAMAAVWDRLEYNFPACNRFTYKLWQARRDGSLQRFIKQNHPQLIKGSPEGQAEWEALGRACIQFLLDVEIPLEWLYQYPCNWPCTVENVKGYLAQQTRENNDAQ